VVSYSIRPIAGQLPESAPNEVSCLATAPNIGKRVMRGDELKAFMAGFCMGFTAALLFVALGILYRIS
jgi:hypothetical protein